MQSLAAQRKATNFLCCITHEQSQHLPEAAPKKQTAGEAANTIERTDVEAPDARYTELLGNKPEPCHSDLKTPNPHASSSQSQLNLLAAAGLEAQTGQDQQCAPCALQILWEVKNKHLSSWHKQTHQN